MAKTNNQLTLHVVAVLCPCAASTHANGNAYNARTDDKQATDRNQDEPGQIEAQETRRILTLAQCSDRLIAAIGTVINTVTDQVRVDAECRQSATEVLASVF